MDSLGRQPACGFCDGTGLWAEQEGEVAAADPCPLCEGTGQAPVATAIVEESADASAFARLSSVLQRLSQLERQRLYEELHARYDCRIYR